MPFILWILLPFRKIYSYWLCIYIQVYLLNFFLWNPVTSINIIPTTNVYPKGQMKVCYVLGLLQQEAVTSLDILPYSLPRPYASCSGQGEITPWMLPGSNRLFVPRIQIFVFHLLQHIRGIDRWKIYMYRN